MSEEKKPPTRNFVTNLIAALGLMGVGFGAWVSMSERVARVEEQQKMQEQVISQAFAPGGRFDRLESKIDMLMMEGRPDRRASN